MPGGMPGSQDAAMPAPTPDGCVNVPLASLATPDDSEQMQTPAVGDSGTMSVDYIVKSITGDQACVEPSAVNGKPLDGEGDETPTPDDTGDDSGMDAEASSLRDEASNMSNQ